MLIRAAIIFFALSFGAYARNLDGRFDNAPPEVKEWFNSLKNRNFVPCCDTSDGFRLEDAEWEISGTTYRVRIKDKWHDVPDVAILNPDTPRPKGVYGAIVWIRPGTENTDTPAIMCFLPGYAG